mmetsp:Transcript_15115/g.42038  ORF Transcript_15115/g.42038 Transcript_15115/m.42038 type:complete len:85 (+) Transcript_15115:4157-4411(+)
MTPFRCRLCGGWPADRLAAAAPPLKDVCFRTIPPPVTDAFVREEAYCDEEGEEEAAFVGDTLEAAPGRFLDPKQAPEEGVSAAR